MGNIEVQYLNVGGSNPHSSTFRILFDSFHTTHRGFLFFSHFAISDYRPPPSALSLKRTPPPAAAYLVKRQASDFKVGAMNFFSRSPVSF